MNAESALVIHMVEDDEGHAHLIQKNLRRAGIVNKIRHYTTGKEFVDFLFAEDGLTQDDDFDNMQPLILLDLNLPEMDGYEVLRRLKGDTRTQTIPIIVLTTTDNPREIERCYELGCNVYITKPVDYESFAEAIRKLGLMMAVLKLPTAHSHAQDFIST